MNNEIRIAFAKAIIDTIWMKGKISDEERSERDGSLGERTY